MILRSAVLAVLAATAACGAPSVQSSPAAPAITVAAASDLRVAFEELGEQLHAETGLEVTFSFGSSGQLREQILNGAPFDVFASANVEFVDDVISAGCGDPATKTDYAFGRLVLWTPPGGVAPSTVADLADPSYRRIAIANPDHAPYGKAAEQALARAGVLDAVGGRLVFGENIADTLRIAQSGNADVGLVARSLTIGDGRDHALVPEDLHDPLRQALVVTATGDRRAPARAFAAFVGSDAGRRIMARYGFALPGEREDPR